MITINNNSRRSSSNNNNSINNTHLEDEHLPDVVEAGGEGGPLLGPKRPAALHQRGQARGTRYGEVEVAAVANLREDRQTV